MMKADKVIFRALCEKVIALPSKELLHLAEPSTTCADALLLYGFNDLENGLSFLAIGTAHLSPWKVISRSVSNEIILRLKHIKDKSVYLFGDLENEQVLEHVNQRLKNYLPTKDIRCIRSLGYLDNFRYAGNPDVMRFMYRDSGIHVDVLLDKIQDHMIQGQLYSNVSAQKIGKKKGDRVTLRLENVHPQKCFAYIDDNEENVIFEEE